MSDVKKVVRNGLVAVIHSPRYGAGWYSWHGVHDLIFDSVVVGMIENKTYPDVIEDYCRKTYESEFSMSCDDLEIAWIPEGTQFFIEEYHGSETIRFKEKYEWVTA